MRQWIRRNKGFLAFLLCFGVFRTAVADWNPIPSGSMRPTILEGDVVFVDRLAYDLKIPLTDVVVAPLGEPGRGDIVTFSSPRDGTRLIKRIVGLPGDRVAMRRGVLFVNGVAALYEDLGSAPETVTPTLTATAVRARSSASAAARSTCSSCRRSTRGATSRLRTVLADCYFMLGDNRDDSEDSRFIGVVPRHLLIGRARRILVSADILARWQPRIDRLGKLLE